MIKSINHSWAVGDKQRQKYGDTWADIDFYFDRPIYKDKFKNDLMNCKIGTLHVARQNFKFTYKDLITCSKQISKTFEEEYWNPEQVNMAIPINIHSSTVLLTKHELVRLSETLQDTVKSATRSYELGLYL